MAPLTNSSSLESLPSELLLPILVHVTFNGDLACLRLLSPGLNSFMTQQSQFLLKNLCSIHRFPDRLVDAYCQYHAVIPNSLEALLLLSSEVAVLDILCEDEQRLTDPRKSAENETLTNLLWSSTFTCALKAGVGTKQPLRDILAPSENIDGVLPLALNTSFRDFLKEGLGLAELEAVITAINISASKLWSSVFLYKAHSSRVNTFASLSGHTFNIEQAILTEHIIWHGPKWAARMLSAHAVGSGGSFERLLHHHGSWMGSNEDGARIAANGVARLLWKDRQRKVDEEREKLAQLSPQQNALVANLALNPVVWRGSSGDL